MKKYFVYDPNNGFELFDTEAEALEDAKSGIRNCCDGEWDESVTDIVCGVITHQATETDRVDKPPADEIDEDGCDSGGNYWDDSCDYKCNYEMKPIKKENEK